MRTLGDVLGFEVLRSELQAAADEMSIALMRSSFSPVIRDFLDFSTAICMPDGRLAVQGFSLPLHLGAVPRAMRSFLRAFPAGLAPGDVAVLNDPYDGGMHLPDIFLAVPAHADGRLAGYVVVVAHHVDVGGRVPGGSAADSREVFEEGLRLPPVLLRSGGRPVPAVETIVRANVRLPDLLWQDLQAQLASAEIGAGRLAFAGIRSPLPGLTGAVRVTPLR
jgi:N-methylhydantoinase B